MGMIAAPDYGDIAPTRGNGEVDTMTYAPQAPADPRVQTTPSLLDLDQEEDGISMDILFATSPQAEFWTKQKQSKRRALEASGGDNSPRDSPPANNSRRRAKYSSPKSDQVSSVLFLC